jgi:hypothetical protein
MQFVKTVVLKTHVVSSKLWYVYFMNPTKLSLALALFLAPLLFPGQIFASNPFVLIDREGSVFATVLSEQSSTVSDSINDVKTKLVKEVERVLVASSSEFSKITLKDRDSESVVEVTRGDVLAKIEHDDSRDNVQVVKTPQGLAIEQGGVLAHTTYEVEVDSGTKSLMLNTPTGVRYLNLLPADSLSLLTKSKIISDANRIDIVEDESGGLLYSVSGVKTFDVIKNIPIVADVKVFVSATEGGVEKIEMPFWAEFLNLVIQS